jgi:tripartite-type tricarboxylate transporter receptor subunit TctC
MKTITPATTLLCLALLYNKGAAPAHADIVSGQIQVMMANMLSSLPLIRAGRLRALAISSAKRSPVLRALPTIAESGAAGFESGSWFSISASAKTPRVIIDKLNVEANHILNRRLQKPSAVERHLKRPPHAPSSIQGKP